MSFLVLTGMDELKCLVQRLEVAVKHLEAMPGRGAGDSAGGGNPQASLQ